MDTSKVINVVMVDPAGNVHTMPVREVVAADFIRRKLEGKWTLPEAAPPVADDDAPIS